MTADEKLELIAAIHAEVGESHSNRAKRAAWDHIGQVLADEDEAPKTKTPKAEPVEPAPEAA